MTVPNLSISHIHGMNLEILGKKIPEELRFDKSQYCLGEWYCEEDQEEAEDPCICRLPKGHESLCQCAMNPEHFFDPRRRFTQSGAAREDMPLPRSMRDADA